MTISHHLAINLLSVVPGRVGGAEEYTTRVLKAFAAHGPSDLKPVLYTLESFPAAHPELENIFEFVICPIDGIVRSRRVLFESTWLAQKTRHSSAIHHFGGRVPFKSIRPAAVTIHDLQPLEHPENFSSVKAAYLSWAIPRSIRRADLVIAVSDQVKLNIRERFPIEPSKVHTVFSGIEKTATEPSKPASIPTILYPAATYPHKNHLLLIKAFEEAADEHPEIQLILTGGAGRSESRVVQAINQSRHAGRIERTGRISSEKVKELIAVSTAVTFPSSYEGFGQPVLEAMAAGVPVIVGSGTPAAEIVSNPEWTVEPQDVTGWVQAIKRMVTDTNKRNTAALNGITQASNYLWENSAEQLEKVWRQLLTIDN
tara:strand:+ start:1933 stop:3045 length:1113 start_codon:yes stop_codon:yes gene_type:complete